MPFLQSFTANDSEIANIFFRCSQGGFRSFVLVTPHETHAVPFKAQVKSPTLCRRQIWQFSWLSHVKTPCSLPKTILKIKTKK